MTSLGCAYKMVAVCKQSPASEDCSYAGVHFAVTRVPFCNVRDSDRLRLTMGTEPIY